jgi:glucuronoarabinoxylan endo-1,4-beta-xylanase
MKPHPASSPSRLLRAALALVGACPPAFAFAAATVELTATFQQPISGFGGNMFSNEIALKNYSLAWKTSFYNQAFGPGGLNLSLLRVNNYHDWKTAWQAGQDPVAAFDGTVELMQRFRAMQPKGQILMTTWSPPERLKSTGKLAGGSILNFDYANYGRWWLASLRRYRDQYGIVPDYLSIQNEPDFVPATWPGCGLDVDQSATRASYVGAFNAVWVRVKDEFSTVRLMGPDTTATAYNKVQNYLGSMTDLFRIRGIAHHLYNDRVSTTGTANLSSLAASYPWWLENPNFNNELMPKFVTEFSGEPGTQFNDPWDQTSGTTWLDLAVTIHNVLTIEKANGYCVWDIGWGCITLSSSYAPGPGRDYWAIGHYSRYINPGDWRLDASVKDPSTNGTHSSVRVSFFRRDQTDGSKRYVLVLLNLGSAKQTVTLPNTHLTDPASLAVNVYKTGNDGTAKYRLTRDSVESVGTMAATRQFTLLPYSITTIVLD